MNVVARCTLAHSLFGVGRMAEAEAETNKALEVEECYFPALRVLTFIKARQEKWTEALQFAEKAAPSTPDSIGTLAGVLERMGEMRRAEELIKELMLGDTYGAPNGLFNYYLLGGNMDRAVECWEKVIEQRHPLAAIIASIYLRNTSRWPMLAKLMNLPEETG